MQLDLSFLVSTLTRRQQSKLSCTCSTTFMLLNQPLRMHI